MHLFSFARKTIVRRASAAACALAVVASAGTALAGKDGKYYAGATCKGIDNTKAFHYKNTSEVFNAAKDADRTLTCPIIHDEASKNDYSAQVVVWDGHQDRAVECTAYVRNFGAPTVRGWAADASVGTGRDTLKMKVTSTDSSSYYHINCKVPRRGKKGNSYVVAYYAEEF